MKIKPYLNIFICLLCLSTLFLDGCSKQDDFLDAKPNQALTIPSSLNDLQLLLHDENIFNAAIDPTLGLLSSDDYYASTSAWLAANTATESNAYIFAPDIYANLTSINDWNGPYNMVYYANTALDYLPKISYDSSQQPLYNQIKGEALFYRSIAFYNLVQTFAMPYDPVTSTNDLGIPLRLTSDLNTTPQRATVQQCYNQILSDLQTAYSLLPATSSFKTAPSQLVVNALLARIYLAIGNYTQAFQNADVCLSSFSTLTDYNTLTPAATRLSSTYLSEDIYHTSMVGYALPKQAADTTLLKSYNTNDLRLSCYFNLTKSPVTYRGTYDWRTNLYDGIATDEIYLIRAECNARSGNMNAAMKDLNTILIMRWKTGTFVPYTAVSADDALQQIIKERRKELCFRGLRWTDLRRLNKDSRFSVTITRVVNGMTYTLLPNDQKYALPIPNQEIQLGGIPQNPR